MQMAENLNVALELKDISESEEALTELLTIGGKEQTPFLVDSERSVSLYEAEDIVDYLREYGRKASPVAVSRPRVHVGGSVCESCEG
jgi:glutathione S-transferase